MLIGLSPSCVMLSYKIIQLILSFRPTNRQWKYWWNSQSLGCLQWSVFGCHQWTFWFSNLPTDDGKTQSQYFAYNNWECRCKFHKLVPLNIGLFATFHKELKNNQSSYPEVTGVNPIPAKYFLFFKQKTKKNDIVC